jgi:hypothetical protein
MTRVQGKLAADYADYTDSDLNPRNPRNPRLILWFAIALSVPLFASCNKKTPVVVAPTVTPPPPPAPPAYVAVLDTANREFADASYALAARDFTRFLEMVPPGPSADAREFVLFRLGLIYALPVPELQDWSRAQSLLKQLASEFPNSPWRPVGQFIVSLKDQTSALSLEMEAMKTEAARIQVQLDALRNTSSQQTAQITTLKENVDQLTVEIGKRDQRIKQLNDDLQRLIRIDSRTPSSPPRP